MYDPRLQQRNNAMGSLKSTFFASTVKCGARSVLLVVCYTQQAKWLGIATQQTVVFFTAATVCERRIMSTQAQRVLPRFSWWTRRSAMLRASESSRSRRSEAPGTPYYCTAVTTQHIIRNTQQSSMYNRGNCCACRSIECQCCLPLAVLLCATKARCKRRANRDRRISNVLISAALSNLYCYGG